MGASSVRLNNLPLLYVRRSVSGARKAPSLAVQRAQLLQRETVKMPPREHSQLRHHTDDLIGGKYHGAPPLSDWITAHTLFVCSR
jgi:hypothetical protein